MVKIPSATWAERSGTCRITLAPRTTPGRPVAIMNSANCRSRWLSRKWRTVAPMPRATEATLCVAKAMPNGRPISPAPPPESAEKRFASREMTRIRA